MKHFIRVLDDIEYTVEDFNQCCYQKKPMIRSTIPRYSYSQMSGLTRDRGNHSQHRGKSKGSDNNTTNVIHVKKIITKQGLVALRHSCNVIVANCIPINVVHVKLKYRN